MPRCPEKHDAQMPRKTRCPDAQIDDQKNKMPRCPARCPDKMRCPEVKQDAQTSNKMPRGQTRCPEVK